MSNVALGDIVWTEDGYGRVVNVEAETVVVWVFGEHVKRYPLVAIRREVDPTPPHYGMSIIQRQAVIIRDLQKQVKILRQAVDVYKHGLERAKSKLNQLDRGEE